MSFEQLTDEELVAYVSSPKYSERAQQAGQTEMIRRGIVAVAAFNAQSSKQATVMIWLTVAIAVLTVIIAALTVVMVWRA